MQFELTDDFLKAISEALESRSETMVLSLVGELHPADIAEIVTELEIDQSSTLLKFIEGEKASDVFAELDEDIRVEILEVYTPKEIAENIIEHMDSDDAADLVQELDENLREAVISHIEDVEHASDVVDLLSYEESSAGGLMAKELIKVRSHWTILECVREMRKQAQDVDEVFTVYVVDEYDKLLGTLSLKRLLLSPANSKVEEFYNKDVKFAKAAATAEEVSSRMDKYDLVVLPVVDDLHRLIGRITIDDVVDYMKEEAEKDYQMASGITDDVDTNDTIWDITKARIPWLLIGMVGGLLGAQVIEYFGLGEGTQMALFIPLIAAMGGNVGVQSSAIIVQGLANNSLADTRIATKLFKELGVAMLNGTICSSLLLIYGYFFLGSLNASAAISLSLFTVILVAAIFGTLIPLTLNKYKIDPALATGPFITTLNDVIGLAIYFTIGGLMLG